MNKYSLLPKDAPNRIESIDQAQNLLLKMQDSAKRQTTDMPITYDDPIAMVFYLLQGIIALDQIRKKSEETWLLKRVFLWKIAGNQISINKDHKVFFDPFRYNHEIKYSFREIAKLLRCNRQYAEEIFNTAKDMIMEALDKLKLNKTPVWNDSGLPVLGAGLIKKE